MNIHLLNVIQEFTLFKGGISSLSLIIKGELGLKCVAGGGVEGVENNVKEINIQGGRKSKHLRIGKDCNPLGHFPFYFVQCGLISSSTLTDPYYDCKLYSLLGCFDCLRNFVSYGFQICLSVPSIHPTQ